MPEVLTEVDEKLSGRELDAAVAGRVMELKEVQFVGERLQYHVPEHGVAYGGRWTAVVPYYSESIEAAMKVEDQVGEMGKRNDYIAHLWDEVGAERNDAKFWTAQNFNAFWLCVHATPEQRCRAALKAVDFEAKQK